MSLRPVRIVLATPRLLDHGALSNLFRKMASVSLVAAETDLAAAVAVCEARAPDVALLDLSYPGDAALRAGESLVRGGKIAAVAFLDDDVAVGRALRALKIPSAGYFTRLENIYAICEGLRAIVTPVTSASQAVPPSHFLPSVRELSDRDVHGLMKLSEQELDVLALLARGHAVKEIAGLLGVSESTVDNHKSHIMKQLKVGRITQLTLIAMQTGLID